MPEDIEEFDNQGEGVSDSQKIIMLLDKVKTLEALNVGLRKELSIKYSIFYPRTERGLLADYPDLKRNRRFTDISRSELLFVWYYSCEGSPLIDIKDDRQRAKESIDIAFGKKTDVKTLERYMSFNFPEKTKLAITEMRSFKIGPRVIARRMMENILSNWRQITDIDASDNSNFEGKDGVDWTKKKAFVETGATVSKNIGALILQVEGSYAVSVKKEEQEEGDFEDLIEVYHQSKQ